MAEKTKYTNEEVLNQLRDFLKRNGNITVNSFKADKTVCAVNTVIRRFGSWNKALKKIGLTPKEKYTKEEIVEQLKDCYRRNGKVTVHIFDADKTLCSSSVVLDRFGSWTKALEEVGLPQNEYHYTKEEIAEQLRDHYKRNGKINSKTISSDETVCSVSTVKKFFGSWEKAMKELELPQKMYTKEKVAEELKDHYRKNGKISWSIFESDKTVCSTKTVEKLFGSWSKALEELGFTKPKEYVEYDKEKLLLLLKEKVKSGELKKRGDIDKLKGVPGDRYIMKIWGTWTELSELLEVEKPRVFHTKEKLIKKYEKMKEMEEYKDKRISGNEYKKVTGIDSKTIISYFGSWNKFCEIVKNENWYMSKINYTNEELLEMYMKLSIKLGKEETGATGKDIEKEFGFSSGVYMIRFGGINNLRRKLNLRIEQKYESKYTKEGIKKMLLKKYKEYGRTLTSRELGELNEEFPGVTTILKYFETTKMTEVWSEVLKRKKI